MTQHIAYFVQVVTTDFEEYYKRLNQIRRIEGVFALNSNISVKEIKNTLSFSKPTLINPRLLLLIILSTMGLNEMTKYQ